MSFAVSATFIECQYSFTVEDFWDWIRLWPTQFLLLVLDINLTQVLESCFEVPNAKGKKKKRKVFNQFESSNPNNEDNKAVNLQLN